MHTHTHTQSAQTLSGNPSSRFVIKISSNNIRAKARKYVRRGIMGRHVAFSGQEILHQDTFQKKTMEK